MVVGRRRSATRDARRRLDGGTDVIAASHPSSASTGCTCQGEPTLLFTENETNTERLAGVANRTPFVKDGDRRYLVHGRRGAVNPERSRDEGRRALLD